MNEMRKTYEVLSEWERLAYHNDDGSDEDSHELYMALQVAIPLVKAHIECDMCGKKATELESDGTAYCKRCYKVIKAVIRNEQK